MRSTVLLSKTGCLLPFLISSNLFFGWMFFKPLVWLGIGAGLIVLFLINAALFTRSVVSSVSRNNSSAIDVEVEVIDDEPPTRKILS